MSVARPGAPTQTLHAALAALLGRESVLLALDFDGCLAPFVSEPMDARPLPAARDALHRLAALPGVSVALVSGRSVPALLQVADPPPRAHLVGSHGAEFRPAPGAPAALQHVGDPDPPALALLGRVASALAGIAAAHPGVWVEHKPTAAVLHTRRAGRGAADAATRAALDGPAGWPGVHLTHGKEVVELAVTDATKGAAVERLRAALGLPAGSGGVLYAGDDVTDERAFAVLDDDTGDVTVKVGDGETAARHRVADPEAVAELLAAAVTLRGGGQARLVGTIGVAGALGCSPPAASPPAPAR